jgi:hypothetical protein
LHPLSINLHVMSADLFAEFSAPPTNQEQKKSAASARTNAQPAPSFGFFDDLSTAASAPAPQEQPQQPQADFLIGSYGKGGTATADENDDWGDFEGGSTSFASTPPVKQDPFAFPAPNISKPAQSTWSSAPVQSDPFAFPAHQTSQSLQNQWSTATQSIPSSQELWTPAPIIKAKKSTDSSVLFDAEDDFDEDDFGDFEGTDSRSPAPAAPTNTGGAADLLGDLSISSQPLPPTTSRKKTTNPGVNASMSSTKKKSPSSDFGSTARATQSKTSSLPAITKEGESWDTFNDWEASIPTNVPAKAPKTSKEPQANVVPKSATLPPPILSSTFDDPQPGELPPTNVPPPAVLLTLFPPLFTEAQNKLFKPMAAQTLPMRNKILSEPATIAYLQGYLMLASVAAQIIAGRKLRWKRDQHLSQGMKIGPASSRATSGMKLSTIDKSENMKEEREASDVVRAWKDQLGRLRHVVSAANQVKAGTLGVVPDMQETMPVKVLKQVEGGVPAPQPCMLCGLKRDERIGAVDQGIEDSFGEWWVEQVNMHRGTRPSDTVLLDGKLTRRCRMSQLLEPTQSWP